MAYNIDKDLQEGLNLLNEGKQTEKAFKLINKSVRKGTTKGKSFFEVARILGEGLGGLNPNAEEARRYYDASLATYAKMDEKAIDGMDYRNLGDYFSYGLGTESIDVNKALNYYRKGAALGDQICQDRINALEREAVFGSAASGPVISATAPAPAPAPVAPAEEAAPIAQAETVAAPYIFDEAAPAPATAPAPVEASAEPEIEPEAEAEEPEIEEAPSLRPSARSFIAQNDYINSVAQKDILLVNGIRIINSPLSTASDIAEGVELVQKACDQGSMRAAVYLGHMYEGGDYSVVAKNLALAKDYYEIAVGRGSSSAEYYLGLLYLNPDFQQYNTLLGHEHILNSARKGYSYALNYLGDVYRQKVNDPKNLELAYRYYALAGERGLGLAYHNMAEIDASRQETLLAREHERYAILHGYDPVNPGQDPLFFSIQ